MLSILFNKKFGSLFWSSLFSALGDSIYMLTISWFIAESFQSASLMGTVLLAMGIARFAFGIIGGAIVDRVGAKRVMIVSDLCRALLMVVTWLMIESGWINVGYLMALSVIFGIVDAFYWPAVEALQQRIVDVEEYARANSLYYTLIRLINMFGPMLAGYLLVLSSYGYSLAATAIAFLLSAIFLYRITASQDAEHALFDESGSEFANFRTRLKEGFHYVKATKILLILMCTMFFSNIGANGVMAILPFFVQELGYGADGLGILRVALAIGSFAIGLFFSIRVFKTVSLHYVTFGFMGQGLFLLLVFWMPEMFSVSVALFMVGVCTAVIGIFIPTLLQTIVPQQLMGQVGGMMMTVAMASTPFAHFLFGGLTDLFGAKPMFLIAGMIEVLTGAVVLIYVKLSNTSATFHKNVAEQ